MQRNHRRRSRKTGLSPGTMVHVGERKTETPSIHVVSYNKGDLTERQGVTVSDVKAMRDSSHVMWVDVSGLHDVRIIEEIGREFNIHPLTLEDIVNTSHHPKIEEYEEYFYIVLKILYHDDKEDRILIEHFSLVLGLSFVLTFRESEPGVFTPVRERIRNKLGRHRKEGPDYLAYSLIDAVVDNYFAVLEHIGDMTEILEEELIKTPGTSTLHTIYRLRRELVQLRKSLWPARDILSLLERSDTPLVKKSTGVFIRDVYDHTIQAADTLETFREMVSGMVEIYLTSISNRTNEIMKVLTMIATIFIPLTFLAGVYGMNFENFPELRWSWFYPVGFWSLSGLIALMLVFYFRKKHWM